MQPNPKDLLRCKSTIFKSVSQAGYINITCLLMTPGGVYAVKTLGNMSEFQL